VRLRSESEQIRKESEQIKKETEQIRQDSERIKKETVLIENEILQIEQETELLKRQNAKGRELLASMHALCYPDASSSTPAPSIATGSVPSSL
jgi:predicted  nucleic acid-binding Zn-ribbon protein